ncbi:transmembrane protein 6/97 [Epithele typhae]|uniref:transmembrane protein 6/97 n=1 Tax=Epithele typhae TaxID=378194 RepID=UPI0020082871|nr:transmembrane protein 6/97 [Epithele typhae]KAH9921688.1 transmembrane protein 6/97 [Epithele typhae]
MVRVPLTQRPRDFAYLLFFAIHIPATLLIDLQSIYPKAWVPAAIAALPRYYVDMSGDPLIGSAMGYFGPSQQQTYEWLRAFMFLEAVFQLPTFVLGIRGLWKGSTSIYTLLLVYAASTATTTIPCITTVLSLPSAPVPMPGGVSLTSEQRVLLLSSYVPFFLVPFVMAIDMAIRIHKRPALSTASREANKKK